MPNPNKQPLHPRNYGEAIKHQLKKSRSSGSEAVGYDAEIQASIAEQGLKPAAINLASRAIAASLTNEHDYRTPEGDKFDVISRLGDFVDNSAKLQELSESHARFERKKPYLEGVIEFNHALRAMIDSDPNRSLPEIGNFLANMYTATYQPNTDPTVWPNKLNYFNQQLSAVLIGMRHEIAAEQIIGTMNDVEYDTDVTNEEEMNGADGFVTMNGLTFPVDIKASLQAVERARQKSPTPENIIHSGVRNEDFAHNGFRIPYDTALEKQAVMRDALEAAYAAERADANARRTVAA